jgi:hypothetical protein
MSSIHSNSSVVRYGTPDAAKNAQHRAEPGRLCTVTGCDTVLSIYNAEPRCSLHSSLVPKHGVA